jgi:hypothetical protein
MKQIFTTIKWSGLEKESELIYSKISWQDWRRVRFWKDQVCGVQKRKCKWSLKIFCDTSKSSKNQTKHQLFKKCGFELVFHRKKEEILIIVWKVSVSGNQSYQFIKANADSRFEKKNRAFTCRDFERVFVVSNAFSRFRMRFFKLFSS